MTGLPDATAQALVDAFVAAYRPWVERRLRELGLVAPPGLGPALTEGAGWLTEQLPALLAMPAAEQRRGPLEVFQEAMRFPTAVLAEDGVPPVERDEAARRALPGDAYDLAPASSQSLGDDAWRAHVAWGAAKAAALAAPAWAQVAYVGNNLMDRSTIDAAAERAGLATAAYPSAEAFADALDTARPPLVVLVDLTASDADDALRAAAAGSGRVIAFGPHVDDWALDRARSLGADQALPRSRFFRTLDTLLPRRV
jgi:hypothetical protein